VGTAIHKFGRGNSQLRGGNSQLCSQLLVGNGDLSKEIAISTVQPLCSRCATCCCPVTSSHRNLVRSKKIVFNTRMLILPFLCRQCMIVERSRNDGGPSVADQSCVLEGAHQKRHLQKCNTNKYAVPDAATQLQQEVTTGDQPDSARYVRFFHFHSQPF